MTKFFRALSTVLLLCGMLLPPPSVAADPNLLDLLKQLPGAVKGKGAPDKPAAADKPAPARRDPAGAPAPATAGQSPAAGAYVIQVPRTSDVSGIQAIAIGDFRGQLGDQVAHDVEALLSGIRIDGAPAYRLVPREETMRVQAPHNESWAMEVGKRLKVDAVLSGEMTEVKLVPTPTPKSERICVQKKPGASTVEGLLGVDCLRWQDVQKACVTYTANVRALVRLYDARQASLVRSEQVLGQSASEHCPGAPGASQEQLFADARAQVGAAVRDLVAPGNATIPVPLMASADQLRSGPGRQKFGEALSFVQQGRADRACPLFRDAYDSDKESVALTFDLGLCEEAGGRAFEARALYETADKMSSASDARITEAMSRTERALKRAQGQASGAGNAKGTAPAPAVVTQMSGDKALAQIAERIRQEKRIALVIGNAAYRRGALRNPVNDAQDMADILKKLGFEVMLATDTSRERMIQAMDQFGRRLAQDTVAIFYYAGHGMQVKGENYLVPVDAEISNETEVTTRAVNVAEVLGKFEAAHANVGLVVLDACRDNPFSRSFRSTQTGLASIDAPRGVLISYATAPGKVSADGTGRNGVFTQSLLRVLKEPNLKVEDVFKRVRVEVTNATNGEQLPWESSSLVGDFFFSVQVAQ